MPDIIDYLEECDYNALKNGIKQILLRYFKSDDNGDQSPFYDPDNTAQNAVDDIHDLIGDI